MKIPDPQTGELISVFNPRADDWDGHFRWIGHNIDGLTPIGRALIAALELNYPRRIRIRQAEEMFDLFPS